MSTVMCVQILSKYIKRLEIGPVSLFSEFEPRQKFDQSQIIFDNLLGYILSISICMQNVITIFNSVQEIVPFSLFQNLELDKASTDDKCHFAISWARSCQCQCVCKSLSKYSKWSKSYGNFSPFVRGQNQMFDYRALSESQPSASVDFLRVVQFALHIECLS